MKVNLIDENHMTFFLNKKYMEETDFNDKDELEDYFRRLFLKLKSNYDICLQGYYNIDVYIDTYYGCIILLEKEDFEYYDNFVNQIDMCINVHKENNFLYKITDYFFLNKELLNKIKIYVYNDQMYLKITKPIPDISLAVILEHSKLVYDDKKIILRGNQMVI